MELWDLSLRVCFYEDFVFRFINRKSVTKGHPLINGQVFENHAVFACTLKSASRKVGL